MTKRPLVLLCLTVACIALPRSASRAQSQDPHLPLPSSIPQLSEFIRVDDMLLWPEQYQQLMAPPVSRRQANVSTPGQRQFYWEWGVVPYELAPNFSDAEVQRIRTAMQTWGRTAPITFVPRTTQTGYLAVTRDALIGPEASPCFASGVGHRLGSMARLNLGADGCQGIGTMLHELGHVLGYHHEHQRADRDTYITIDLGNIAVNARYAFDRYTFPTFGPYRLGSVMHYSALSFALDLSRPTIIPKPGYQRQAAQMGQR